MNSIDFSYLDSSKHRTSRGRECYVHGEDDAATEDQATQTRDGTRPEGQDPFFFEDLGGALEAVLVETPRFY